MFRECFGGARLMDLEVRGEVLAGEGESDSNYG